MIGHIICYLLVFLNLRNAAAKYNVTITVPGALPEKDDDYLCSAFQIKDWIGKETVFINNFAVNATAKKVHHMLIYSCSTAPREPGTVWNCMHHSICEGESKLLYAWAKDAPPAKIPDGVGFKVGFPYRYIVLQLHYVHPLPSPDHAAVEISFTDKTPKYYGGIYLLVGWKMGLPAHSSVIHDDVNCKLSDMKAPKTLFAFRTHTHSHGTVVTGYLFRNNKIREIARHDPQEPQMFYAMSKEVAVNNGDYIAARCTFNTTEENHMVFYGATSKDEMCNLYLMFYSQIEDDGGNVCSREERSDITNKLPLDSDKLLPDKKKRFLGLNIRKDASDKRMNVVRPDQFLN